MSRRDWRTRVHKDLHPEQKHISVGCNIRHYDYTAHLDSKTGEVMAITAGCRKWRSFKAAFAHYDSGRFSESQRTVQPCDVGRVFSGHTVGASYTNSVQRLESRAVLKKLQHKCDAFRKKVCNAAR